MLRLTRPFLQAAAFRASASTRTYAKSSTGITGLAVHPDPLPTLLDTYRATLAALASIPSSSAYRQGAEALTRGKLSVVERASADGKNDVAAAERELDDGQIEEAIQVAQDELSLAGKMIEWKAWEPLEEKPQPGQWQYFGKTTQFK